MKTNLKGLMIMGAIALGQVGQLQAADANPPERMTYQGYLVDGNGDPLGKDVPANYDVVFRIYDAKSGGNKIWSEQQTVTVDKGYFSVLLGEGVEFSNEVYGNLSAAFDGTDASDRFIGITVIGLGGVDTEIAPRLRLVTSPYSFTASQARRLTDGSGNANFFKDGASLKLGAGSTPTLTLPEAGGASLVGKLTVDLPSWGTGLQIDNGSQTTTIGAQNSGLFHFNTGLPQFYFNKNINVNGNIRSYNTDTIIGPSNNTDTYLKILSASDDIHAYADNFYFKGAADLKVEIEAGSVDFRTTAPSFYMNKPLEVNGSLTATGYGNISVNKPDNEEAVLSLYGPSQGTGRLFVGQSLSYGGGIVYNGDGTPAFDGGSTDKISFYRTANSVNHEVFNYSYASNDVTFNGSVTASAMTASSITGTGRDMFLQGDAPTFFMQDSNDKDYMLHTNGDRLYFLRGENGYGNWDSTRALTIYQGNKVGVNVVTPLDELHIVHGGGSYGKGLRLQNSGYPQYYWTMGVDYSGDFLFGYNINDGGTYSAYINSSDGSWVKKSDKKLKKDIEPLGSVLDRLSKLVPSKYRFKTQSEDETKSYGFIAQEVDEVFPDIVAKGKDFLSLTYDYFGVLSVKAIQELRSEKDQQLAERDKQLAEKTRRIDELEGRMAKLEELVSKIGQGQ